MTLQVYNTLHRRKEPFEPLRPGFVGMYNCGPTVYSYVHIGNFASFLLADLLRRHLEYSGFEVRQIMNITDVGHLTDDDVADARGEDKLEKKAREEKKDPWQIAAFYEKAFHADRKLLDLLPAHVYPRATDHIPQMLAMIEELLRVGLAYEAGGQIYFEIAKYPRYGSLSGTSIDELMAGPRVEEDPLKRSPLDFTLWKRDPKHVMKWPSPFGEGFPGWHIECSAMSREYLGDVFDIHTGGEDNIFPHHECELAQSSGGTDRIFARYWLHRRHIFVDGKKMAKSAGNFYTVRDLLARGHSGLEIRFALLSTHYRSTANFTFQGLDAARETLRYLREFRVNMSSLPVVDTPSAEAVRVKDLCLGGDAAFRAGLDDDLNVSAALREVHALVSGAYKLCTTRVSGRLAAAQLEAWDSVLGVLGEPAAEVPGEGGDAVPGLSVSEVERIIGERDAARAAKDFAASDRIRDHLKARGIVLKDTPQGTRWHLEAR
ncbi:MAG TPA: cysteine--tRNA ligase [Planctomycetota bacterium]|nr:cysteine--tRNA ligase [Planctomycetota bacterium]